jgi:hypothetical protein
MWPRRRSEKSTISSTNSLLLANPGRTLIRGRGKEGRREGGRYGASEEGNSAVKPLAKS